MSDLARLVMFSGRISSAHVKNLEAFPFIFFNGHIKDPQLDYSIETTDKNKPTVFTYVFTLNLEANDHLDKRYKALEEALRSLFWKEVVLEVKINGQEVYKSEKN